MYLRPMGDLGQIIFMVKCRETIISEFLFLHLSFTCRAEMLFMVGVISLDVGVGCEEQGLYQTGFGAF